ncbi:hypothetical protein HY948_04650 [Candidatus Gottesmanbacteria bacterium]|nr:hypothetical protein [Candidatus Gottesmanbacteria bacterium]
MTLMWIIAAIFYSIMSFNAGLYVWLESRIGVGWSYVIDQSLPMVIAVIFLLQSNLVRPIARTISQHKIQIGILLTAGVIAHGLILRYYFFAEDSSSILTPVTNGAAGFPFHYIINGYPFASFVLSYLLFGTNAWFYNIVSLFWFIFAAVSLYFLVFVISNKKSIALLSSLYFATTPVFLDVFSWQANAQGMPLVLGLHILSFIFLYRYSQKRASIYYLLSLLFFIASVKMGFVRIAGLVFGLFAILWMPAKRKRSIIMRLGESFGIGLVWLGFIGIRLIPGGWSAVLEGVLKKSNVVVASPFRWDIYSERLAYYMAQLVMPNAIGAFPSMRMWIGSLVLNPFIEQYLIYGIGLVSLIGFIIIGFLALFRLKNQHWVTKILVFSVVLILSSMFYVPLYITTKSDLLFFPFYFSRITPPYGPGARYVFAAAVGVSTLFGVGLYWLWGKKGIVFGRVGWIVTLVVLMGNSMVSIQGHRGIVEGISNKERALIDKFFAMVPRDGKPKLIYSVNPVRNALDVNVAGWRWLYGFYRTDELFYSNDVREIRNLIESGIYTKDRFFAFYANPETSVFANISGMARRIFFEKENSIPVPIVFEEAVSETEFTKIDTNGTLYLAKRPMLTSREIGERLLLPTMLEISLGQNILPDVQFPFSDAVIIPKEARVPGQFWWMIKEYAPIAARSIQEILSSFTVLSFQDRLLGEINLDDRIQINRAIQKVDLIRQGIRASVSGLDETDARVRAQSLIDGVFVSDPSPAPDEIFYLGNNNLPIEIILSFAESTDVGRILLNTPKNMVSERMPLEGVVYGSRYGESYVKIGRIGEDTKISWSPNNGGMHAVTVIPGIYRSVKIVITQTPSAPVSLDEIVIEPVSNRQYSPDKIFELAGVNWHYVNDFSIQETLSSLIRYKTMLLAWVCAEDADWSKQNQNQKTLIGGLWHFRSFPLQHGRQTVQTALDCSGSILRKIIVVGSPNPSSLEVYSARIQ